MMIALSTVLFMFIPLTGMAADTTPVPPSQPDQPPSAEAPKPEPPPSRDPGIVKQPETVPHPDAVITPPVVDPKMAVNPEEPQAQPGDEGKRTPAPEQPAPPAQPR